MVTNIPVINEQQLVKMSGNEQRQEATSEDKRRRAKTSGDKRLSWYFMSCSCGSISSFGFM